VIFEQAAIGVAQIVTSSGQFYKVNKKYCDIVGYSEEEMLKINFMSLTHPEDLKADLDNMELLKSGKIREFSREKRYSHKNGDIVWVNLTVSPMWNPGEMPDYHIAVVQDITERKQAEEALKEREEQLRLFIEYAPAAIAMFDRNMRYLVVSRRWVNDYRLENNQILGHSHYEIFPEIPQRWKDIHQRCMTGAAERCEEDPFPRTDGSLDWVCWEVRPWHNSKEEIGGIIIFSELITARKRAEATLRENESKFRTIIEVSPVPYALNDEQQNITYLNAAFVKTFGYGLEDIPTLADWWPKAYPDAEYCQWVATTWQARLDKAKQAGTLFEPMELNIRCKDGTLRTAMVGAVSIGETFKGVHLVILYDITERKRAEVELTKYREHLEELVNEQTSALQKTQMALMNIVEDLNQKTAELEKANMRLKELDHLKSMFIALMSHELRTPLNSIIGFSSIILDEWLGPINAEQKENISTVLRSGKHLLSLINDIIDVSKIESGMIEPYYESFDIYDTIKEAVSSVENQAKDKGLELRVESIHQQIHTDKRRLLQCILNLLSNAVKFTERGSVSVKTRLNSEQQEMRNVEFGIQNEEDKNPQAAIDSDSAIRIRHSAFYGNFIEICVTDTGIGIKEEDMPKIFLPFVRLDSPLKAKVPGTGLGLYLTKKLVTEVLKGEISVESRYGEGSRFVVRIPVNGE